METSGMERNKLEVGMRWNRMVNSFRLINWSGKFWLLWTELNRIHNYGKDNPRIISFDLCEPLSFY